MGQRRQLCIGRAATLDARHASSRLHLTSPTADCFRSSIPLACLVRFNTLWLSLHLGWAPAHLCLPIAVSVFSAPTHWSLLKPLLLFLSQRARTMARMLLAAGCAIGLVLGVVVAVVPRVWGHVLAADVRVRQGVLAVSLQNALSSWLCAIAIVLDGVGIGSGKALM